MIGTRFNNHSLYGRMLEQFGRVLPPTGQAVRHYEGKRNSEIPATPSQADPSVAEDLLLSRIPAPVLQGCVGRLVNRIRVVSVRSNQ